MKRERVVRFGGVLGMVVAAAAMAGCELQPDRGSTRPVQQFTVGAAPMVGEAPFEGDYVLFRGDAKLPIARAALRQGERLGFERDAVDTMGKPVGFKGQISAVAGQLAVPLSEGFDYEWRFIPDSDRKTKQSNPHFPRR
ncbi:MAG: hypothetical protein ACK4PI_05060 [Tepidisphaerales bacterium]